VSAVGSESRATHGVWLWRHWTRWPLTPTIVVVAALAIGLDVVTAWRHVTMGSLGRVEMSPALPLGIFLALLVGLRRLGLDRANLAAWREFLVVCGAVLVFGICSTRRASRGSRRRSGSWWRPSTRSSCTGSRC